MKLAIVALACVIVGAFAQEHPPDRGAVPCFYWDDQCTSSYGVDFPGNDIATYKTSTTSACCTHCKATEGCMHWVAKKDGYGGYDCYLKSVYGFPTYCTDCTFSYTKSEACKQFCETTCHNLGQFGPAVCGTDGYTYESPCQMQCTAVSQAAPGECDSPFRDGVHASIIPIVDGVAQGPVAPEHLPVIPYSDAGADSKPSAPAPEAPEKPEPLPVEPSPEPVIVAVSPEPSPKTVIVEASPEPVIVAASPEPSPKAVIVEASTSVEGSGSSFASASGTAGDETVSKTSYSLSGN